MWRLFITILFAASIVAASIVDDLKELAELAKENLLSEEEFARGKHILLAERAAQLQDTVSKLKELAELAKENLLSEEEYVNGKHILLSERAAQLQDTVSKKKLLTLSGAPGAGTPEKRRATQIPQGVGGASAWLKSDNAKLVLGSAGDTDLFRAGEGHLKTSGKLTADGLCLGSECISEFADGSPWAEATSGNIARSTGKVGIGTTQPRSKLHITGGDIEIGSLDTRGPSDDNGFIPSGRILFKKCHTVGCTSGTGQYHMGAIGTYTSNGYAGGLAFYARRSSAEHLIATKALRCTATAWILIVAESFAKF